VRVQDVRTINVRGKMKRFGRFVGKRSNWKKAYVRLAEGDSLNFYDAAATDGN
jgi:large subunit ribosomal protein L23